MSRCHAVRARTLCLVVLLAAGPGKARGEPVGLVDAYKKEYAFLEAEKRALTRRLNALTARNKERLERAQAEITALQARLIETRARAEAEELALREAEQLAGAADEEDRVGEVFDRATQSLAAAGVTLGERPERTNEASRLSALRRVFAKGAAAVTRGASTRRRFGSFYLADGTRVSGTLVQVGGVATYGVSDRGAGVLAPAGEGRLRVWTKAAEASARAVASGRAPGLVEIFIYESQSRAVEPKRAKTPVEVVQSGGIIAWVIVGLGGLALVLVVLRALTLWRARTNVRALLARVRGPLVVGDHMRAVELCRETSGAAARVLAAAIPHVSSGRDRLEDVVAEAVARELPRIERFSAIIAVLAAVAPLMGLLGTVTGMISTFDVITEHGTGDPKLLSGGISEALVTTELGLIVAIPTLLLGALLAGRARAVEAGIERAALRVVNLALGNEQGPNEAGTAAHVRVAPRVVRAGEASS